MRDSAVCSPANTSPPTRSPFATAAHASSEAVSAATTDLNARRGAEPHVLAEIHDEENRAIALLVEELRMGAAGACGHSPVDAADIVTGQVDSRL